jgi:steroid delta-isomerase-like uncharacterized protein
MFTSPAQQRQDGGGSAQVVRRWIEVGFGAGELAVADDTIAPDFVNHTALPGQSAGRDGLKQAVTGLRSAFADLTVDVLDLVAEGDVVAVRDTIRGVHRGTFAGVPATGKSVQVNRLAFYHVRDSRIVEHWAQIDMLGLLQQLGAIPGAPTRTPAEHLAPVGGATSTDSSKHLVRRLFEQGLSPGDMGVVAELVAADLRLYGAPSELPPGRAGLEALLGVFRAGFPDYTDTVDELIGEDDRVAVRWTFSGTHTGAFQGIAPTRRVVRLGGMSFFRVADNQVVDDWTQMDMFGLMQQIK